MTLSSLMDQGINSAVYVKVQSEPMKFLYWAFALVRRWDTTPDKEKHLTSAGIEPRPLDLIVHCSTDWATRPDRSKSWVIMLSLVLAAQIIWFRFRFVDEMKQQTFSSVFFVEAANQKVNQNKRSLETRGLEPNKGWKSSLKRSCLPRKTLRIPRLRNSRLLMSKY